MSAGHAVCEPVVRFDVEVYDEESGRWLSESKGHGMRRDLAEKWANDIRVYGNRARVVEVAS